jgi:hypothetical protein
LIINIFLFYYILKWEKCRKFYRPIALGEDIRNTYFLALLLSLLLPIFFVENGNSDTLAIMNHISSYEKYEGNNDAIIYGCTDPNACNYDPAANVDDDSCVYHDCEVNGPFSYLDLLHFTTL